MIHKELLDSMMRKAFEAAESAAESHAMLAKSEQQARIQLEEQVLGDVGFRERMEQIRAGHEAVSKRFEGAIRYERERFDSATSGAFVLDPGSLAPQTVAFLGSVALDDDEARVMLRDSVGRGDLASARLVEANLAKQGKAVDLGVKAFDRRMSDLAGEVESYARAIGSESNVGYFENRPKIEAKIAAQADEAERVLLAFPIAEVGGDE